MDAAAYEDSLSAPPSGSQNDSHSEPHGAGQSDSDFERPLRFDYLWLVLALQAAMSIYFARQRDLKLLTYFDHTSTATAYEIAGYICGLGCLGIIVAIGSIAQCCGRRGVIALFKLPIAAALVLVPVGAARINYDNHYVYESRCCAATNHVLFTMTQHVKGHTEFSVEEFGAGAKLMTTLQDCANNAVEAQLAFEAFMTRPRVGRIFVVENLRSVEEIQRSQELMGQSLVLIKNVVQTFEDFNTRMRAEAAAVNFSNEYKKEFIEGLDWQASQTRMVHQYWDLVSQNMEELIATLQFSQVNLKSSRAVDGRIHFNTAKLEREYSDHIDRIQSLKDQVAALTATMRSKSRPNRDENSPTF